MTLMSTSVMENSHKHLSRGVDHLGFIEKELRDLRGFSTLAYELIQNADDAPHATIISFDITDDALVVDNNGMFTDCGQVESLVCAWRDDPSKQHLCDFHRFRSIASGDKRREEGTTGAFGIGFIAVYQITDHPELISAGRHWILHDEKPEDKRIRVCEGCEKCQASDLPGTRFILPWATDQNSYIRKTLRVEPISKQSQKALLEELKAKLPIAMIFLKKLERIEIKENGKLVKYFERILEDDQLLITDGEKGNDLVWNIIEGEFRLSAEKLRGQHPGRIEEKRSCVVQIALPENFQPYGRLCVCLPTEHDTALPFHINADFYPSSDRKKIIFESGDYQSEWNCAAIEGAAQALADNFGRLPEIMNYKDLWKVILSIYKVWKEAKDRKRSPILGLFWERLSTNLQNYPIVYTENQDWVSPSQAVLLGDREEELIVPILHELGLKNIVNRDIRSDIFQLPWSEVLGIEQLDLDHLIDAFYDKGLTKKTELSSLPKTLQTAQGRRLMNGEIIRLLKRQRSAQKRHELETKLRGCAIVLGKDGALWPCEEIYRADEKTISLFSRVDSSIPFVAETGEEIREIVELCPQFSVKVAIDCLERSFKDRDSARHVPHDIDPKELLSWFEVRRDDLLSSEELKYALSELPIFPGPGGLFPLSNLALPGGFEDPIGITEIIDLKRLSGKRDFLRELGAKELSFEIYAKDHIPRAFKENDLPLKKKRDLIELLAKELGKIRGNLEIRKNLAVVPLIECVDQHFRPPKEAYFPEKVVTDVLGESVRVALLPCKNKEAISELYDWLGVSKSPRPSDVVHAVQSLIASPPNQDSINRVISVLQYIGEIYRRENELSEEFESLQSLPWLPAKGNREQWFKPQELYSVFRVYLFESQATFLDVPREIQNQVADLLKWLGVNIEPTPSLVVKHLLFCSERRTPVNKEVYRYLNDNSKDPTIEQLTGKACLLDKNNQYFAADHAFWAEHPFGRFRYKLNPDMRKYSDLLEKLGVREHPGPQDAKAVLLEIAHQYGKVNQPLDEEAYAVCMACWRIMSTSLQEGEIGKEEIESLSGEKVIPDDRKVLNIPTHMFFEDRAGLAEKFGDFLKHNVIPRHQGVWKAMEAAGVRTLRTAVEPVLLECTDPVEDGLLKGRIISRKTQLARVLDPFGDTIKLQEALSILETLTYVQSTELKIQYLLRAFDTECTSSPENVPASYHQNEGKFYYVRKNGNISWPSIARELALCIAPELDPGQLASGLKEVLSAQNDKDAEMVLNELGFAPLEPTKTITPVSEEVVDDFGGDQIPEEKEPLPQPSERVEEDLSEQSLTPGEALSGIFGEAGVPPTDTAQPIEEAERKAEHGRGKASADGISRQERTKALRKKKGKLRTYVYAEGSEYEEPPNHHVSEQSSAVDKAGIDRVVEYERYRGRIAKVMPHEHPGYDIESRDESGEVVRYIEVKSLSGDWGASGAALTKTQFEKGIEFGDRYWLYVVERAQQDNYKIHPIQNPAQRVNEFIYDDGWKNVASTDTESQNDKDKK